MTGNPAQCAAERHARSRRLRRQPLALAEGAKKGAASGQCNEGRRSFTLAGKLSSCRAMAHTDSGGGEVWGVPGGERLDGSANCAMLLKCAEGPQAFGFPATRTRGKPRTFIKRPLSDCGGSSRESLAAILPPYPQSSSHRHSLPLSSASIVSSCCCVAVEHVHRALCPWPVSARICV